MTIPNFSIALTQVLKPLQDFSAPVMTTMYPEWFGPDNSADDAVRLQATVDQLASSGGGIVRCMPGKTYLSSIVNLKPRVHIDGNGATIKAKSSSNNYLFNIHNAVLATKTLTTGLQFATTVTLNNTTGINPGDRVIVSAGTFTGSGVEHGPCEFNTVKTVTDGTHLVLKSPLQYSYSAMGMTGAAPIVQVLGPEDNLVRDIRIWNLFLQINGSDNPLYFGLSNTERIEIDRIGMNGKGDTVLQVGYASQVNFHDNRGWGPSANGAPAINSSGLVQSWIEDNSFNFEPAASGGGGENAFVFEVMTRDNVIARNRQHRIDGSVTAFEIAMNFGFGAFNNHIIDNRAFGVNLSNSYETWFARTYENCGNADTFGGNTFQGNRASNFLNGIGDQQYGSIIDGNSLWNDTLCTFSTGLVTLSDRARLGTNYYKNIARPEPRDGSTNIVRVQSLPGGDLGTIWGNGSPEGVVTAPVGMVYVRRDGGAGTTLYLKESGTGNTGWIAYGDPSGKENLLTSQTITPVTFQNSWSNYNYNGADSTTGAQGAYSRDRGVVRLQGFVKAGTTGTNIFTLPSGYRPSYRHVFVVNDSGAFGRVDVLADGSVLHVTGTGTYVSLDGIAFTTGN